MAFVVEDGTGLANATAYQSVADFKTYHADRGNEFAAYSDTQIEAALVQGSDFIDCRYQYLGNRTRGRDQSMEWPRGNVCDPDGWMVDSNSLPPEVTEACNELALFSLGNILIPNLSFDPSGGGLLTERTDTVGTMRTTRRYSAFGNRQQFREFPKAEAVLRRLAKLTKQLERSA